MALKKFIIILSILATSATVAVYFASNVDTSVTQQDMHTIESLQLEIKCRNKEGFENELQCVKAIQDTVYSHVEVSRDGIKEEQSREPADLMAVKKGLCYDRSRFIEKVLTYYGFEIRHVSIFYTKEPSLKTLISSSAKSHAFLEVLTSKGWMLVDSIDRFIATDKENRVYNSLALRNYPDREGFIDVFGNRLPSNFLDNYMVVYGLYSRHGKFYPPYVPIPDINWVQLFKYN